MNKLSVRERMARLHAGYRDESNTLQRLRQAERDAFDAAREATVALLDATNTMGAEDPVMLGVITGIIGTHRYLQAQGLNAVIKALGEFGRLAETERLTDARNEHIVHTIKVMRESLREQIYWEE